MDFQPSFQRGKPYLPYHWKVIPTDDNLSERSIPVSHSSGHMVTQGSQPPHQHIGAQNYKDGSAPLDPPSSGTTDQSALRQHHGCCLYQSPRGSRSHAALKEASQIISWTEKPCPAISPVSIPGVDNWMADYLMCIHLDQREWTLYNLIWLSEIRVSIHGYPGP